ncbi:unnamed protein product, partial [Rotaria sp. Silwood1]
MNSNQLKKLCLPHGVIYSLLSIIIICLTILTIVYASLWRNNQIISNNYAVENGIIGSRISLPNDGQYIQWNFLQMNDVYELLPLD